MNKNKKGILSIRYGIIEHLNRKKELQRFTDIKKALGTSDTVIDRELRLLVIKGWVIKESIGYRLNRGNPDPQLSDVLKHLAFCTNTLEAIYDIPFNLTKITESVDKDMEKFVNEMPINEELLKENPVDYLNSLMSDQFDSQFVPLVLKQLLIGKVKVYFVAEKIEGIENNLKNLIDVDHASYILEIIIDTAAKRATQIAFHELKENIPKQDSPINVWKEFNIGIINSFLKSMTEPFRIVISFEGVDFEEPIKKANQALERLKNQ